MLKWSKAIDISPLICEQTAVFPGDQKFERSILMDMQNKDHLTLSSIKSTVHIGAHTDAPNHYDTNGAGIDEVSLEPYLGDCQVIDVSHIKTNLIKPENIKDKIASPRVLFKTKSFPNPMQWQNEFFAFAPDTITFLHHHQVQLVGIDTPSIDLATSKTLDAHRLVAKYKMSILEGVILDHVDSGAYYLMALPLKIKNADASPVRAILLPK